MARDTKTGRTGDYRVVYIDGSNPTRSENPLRAGWYVKERIEGSEWIVYPHCYSTEAAARDACSRSSF